MKHDSWISIASTRKHSAALQPCTHSRLLVCGSARPSVFSMYAILAQVPKWPESIIFVPPTRPDTALVSPSRGSVGCSIALLSIALGTAPWDCSLGLPSITLGGMTPRHNASRPLPVRRLAGAWRSWPHCGECRASLRLRTWPATVQGSHPLAA